MDNLQQQQQQQQQQTAASEEAVAPDNVTVHVPSSSLHEETTFHSDSVSSLGSSTTASTTIQRKLDHDEDKDGTFSPLSNLKFKSFDASPSPSPTTSSMDTASNNNNYDNKVLNYKSEETSSSSNSAASQLRENDFDSKRRERNVNILNWNTLNTTRKWYSRIMQINQWLNLDK